MTHPFHPLAGQELEFVKRRKSWQLDRVYVYDTAGELVSLPAEWTDVVAPDPFVVVSAGRSPFHIGGWRSWPTWLWGLRPIARPVSSELRRECPVDSVMGRADCAGVATVDPGYRSWWGT